MQRSRKGLVQITPAWKGSLIEIHVEGQLIRQPAPADGLHFAMPGGCHFFVDSRQLYDELFTVDEGPKKPKKLL